MKTKFTGLLCLIIAAFTLILTPFQLAFAQTSSEVEESITLSPAISKPVADSGTVLKGSLTVINNGQTEYQFLAYARPFSVSTESYDPNYTEVNERTEAYQWVQFAKTNIRLAPGERVEVPYTVTIPEKAKSGGHYAVLFAETQPKQAEGTQVTRKKRVGSLLYITVNGELINSGLLVGWDAKVWQKSTPVEAAMRIKNDGNVHFQVNSQVTFRNIFNKPRLQLNQEQFVLPGTTRKIMATMENAPIIGIYRVGGTVSFLDKKELLPSKWIVLVPIKAVNLLIAVIALVAAWLLLKPRIKARRSSSNTASRRGKK